MKEDKTTETIRVMTYNVHSCRGLDGKVDPKRICQVIEHYNPDLVALQELDVNRGSSHNLDQPSHIAEYLRMHCHFQPVMALDQEHYGIAILSRYPFDLIKADHLKRSIKEKALRLRLPVIKYFYEPRGAIGVRVTIGTRDVIFFTTHLGLRGDERGVQISDMLSDNWLGTLEADTPTVFCGDFNTGPKSRLYKTVSENFKEVKGGFAKGQRRKTFYSPFPLLELDHIFYKGDITLVSAQVPQTELTRRASDHLPLIADFHL